MSQNPYSLNPVHPHCGINLSVNPNPSKNRIDEICRQHDLAYGKIGPSAYFYYSEADNDFIKDMSKQTGPLATFYTTVFKGKALFAPNLKQTKELPMTNATASRSRSRSRPRAATGPVTRGRATSITRRSRATSVSSRRGRSARRSTSAARPASVRRRRPTRTRRSRRTRTRSAVTPFDRLWNQAKINSAVKTIYDYGWWNEASSSVNLTGNISCVENAGNTYSNDNLTYSLLDSEAKAGEAVAGYGKWGMFDAPGQRVYSGGVVTGVVQFRQGAEEVFLIKELKLDYSFTNTGTAPLDIWVCLARCRKSTVDSWMQEFSDSYNQQSVFKSDTITIGPGTAPARNVLLTDVAIGSHVASTASWKMVKKQKIHIDPEMTVPAKVIFDLKNLKYDHAAIGVEWTGATPPTYVKNVSHTVLVSIRGQLGVATAGTVGQTGWTSATCNVMCKQTMVAARANQFGRSKRCNVWDRTNQAGFMATDTSTGSHIAAVAGSGFKHYDDTLTAYP